VHRVSGSVYRVKSVHASSIDMYNNDVGKRFMKQTGALKDATLYFDIVIVHIYTTHACLLFTSHVKAERIGQTLPLYLGCVLIFGH